MLALFLPIIKIIGIIVACALIIYIIIEIIFRRHRIAEYCWDDGSQYNGQVNHYGINGTGIFVASEGSTYQGHFKKGVFHGNGKYTWMDGSTFNGLFKNGNPVEGVYTDVDGNVFKCKFRYMVNGARITDEFVLIEGNVNDAVVSQTEIAIEKICLTVIKSK